MTTSRGKFFRHDASAAELQVRAAAGVAAASLELARVAHAQLFLLSDAQTIAQWINFCQLAEAESTGVEQEVDFGLTSYVHDFALDRSQTRARRNGRHVCETRSQTSGRWSKLPTAN